MVLKSSVAWKEDTGKSIREYAQVFRKRWKNSPVRQTLRIFRRRWRERLSPTYPKAGRGCVDVPAMLQPPSLRHANYEGPWLEEEFLRKSGQAKFSGAKYLPILWDNFFAQAQAGAYLPGEFERRFRAMWELLTKLGQTDEVYFTLLGIYDFPIWNWHLFPKNIVVFAANGYGDVALPLLFGDRPFRNPAKTMRSGINDSLGTKTPFSQVAQTVLHQYRPCPYSRMLFSVSSFHAMEGFSTILGN